MTSSNAESSFAEARAAGEAAVARLVRFNEPGRMSLAGAYALGYGALVMAQIEEDGPDWYDLIDPLDALVLGTAFPKRFASMYEFANARDRWLELLKGTVHGKGIDDFVRLCLRTGDEFRRPVDDGDLMLVIAGRVENARLDQRKLPVPYCRKRRWLAHALPQARRPPRFSRRPRPRPATWSTSSGGRPNWISASSMTALPPTRYAKV